MEILRELGCDVIQGFLWGRPQPAACIPDILLSGIADPCPLPVSIDSAQPAETRQRSIS